MKEFLLNSLLWLRFENERNIHVVMFYHPGEKHHCRDVWLKEGGAFQAVTGVEG